MLVLQSLVAALQYSVLPTTGSVRRGKRERERVCVTTTTGISVDVHTVVVIARGSCRPEKVAMRGIDSSPRPLPMAGN